MTLIEKTHNDRFVARMEQFMTQWRFYRDQLNRLPVIGSIPVNGGL